MNILILSSGTRNKIVQYFKRELKGQGKVYATDCSELAPSLYDSDDYFIVPKIDAPNYLDTILSICKEYQIDGVLSLIDPELSLLAKHKDDFLRIGTQPIVSNYDLVELCFDKYEFNEFLKENGFNWIRSYIDKEKFFKDLDNGTIEFPVFVKPRRGSASININLVQDKAAINALFASHEDLMIQEFMNGDEYGVDVYADLISKEPTSIFIKKKIMMRAGETDKSESIINEFMFKRIEEFVTKAGFEGIIDIDIFKVDSEYYISEVNPRFGGGYPHAYEVGVNVPKQILNNLQGISNFVDIGNYPEHTFMMKYNDVKMIGNK